MSLNYSAPTAIISTLSREQGGEKRERLARSLLEAARWPAGPQCVRCNALNMACQVRRKPGLWSCKACRSAQYTVTSGTPLHGTRVSLASWITLYLHSEVLRERWSISKVRRELGVSYVTAKNMTCRMERLKTECPVITQRLEQCIRYLSYNDLALLMLPKHVNK